MILFTPSATFVDAIINHPDVRNTIERGTHRLQSASVIHDPNNYVVAYEQGVAVFVGRGLDIYEGHICTLKGSRGAEALRFGKAALHRLFTERRARKVVAYVPLELPAARFYCRRLGLKSESRDLFEEHFSMENTQWAAS